MYSIIKIFLTINLAFILLIAGTEYRMNRRDTNPLLLTGQKEPADGAGEATDTSAPGLPGDENVILPVQKESHLSSLSELRLQVEL